MSATWVLRRPVTAPEPARVGTGQTGQLPSLTSSGLGRSTSQILPPAGLGQHPYQPLEQRSLSRNSSKSNSSTGSSRSLLQTDAEPVTASDVLGEIEDAQPEDTIEKIYAVVKFTRRAVRDVRLSYWKLWTNFFLEFTSKGGVTNLVKMIARGVEGLENPGDRYTPPQMEDFRVLLLNHVFDFLSLTCFAESGDAPYKRHVRECRGLVSSLVAMLDGKPFERAIAAFLLSCFLDGTAAMRIFREPKNMWSLGQILKELNTPTIIPFSRARVRRELYVGVLVLIRRAIVAPNQSHLPFGVDSDQALEFSVEQSKLLAKRVCEAGLADPLIAALRKIEVVCGPADPEKAQEALSAALQCVALLVPFSPCREIWLQAGLRRLIMPMRFAKATAIRGFADAIFHACPANEASKVIRPLALPDLKEQLLRSNIDWIKTIKNSGSVDTSALFLPSRLDLPEPFLGLSISDLRARMYRTLFNEDSDRLQQLKDQRRLARLARMSSMPLLSPGRAQTAPIIEEEPSMCRNCILGLTMDSKRCRCLLSFWTGELETTAPSPLVPAAHSHGQSPKP